MKTPAPDLLHSFLCALGIRIDLLHIREVYDKHPLPHSFRALSDTLDGLHVENVVCRLEFNQLFEIESPFIVAMGNSEYPFYLVEGFDTDKVSVLLRTVFGHKIVQTFDQFQREWDGTVLIAEKGVDTKEDTLLVYKFKQGLWYVSRRMVFWMIVLVSYLLIWGLIKNSDFPDFRYLIKMIGLIISLLTVVKAEFRPQLVRHFCHIGRHSDCNDVFKSAGAKLLGWVSLGELSLAYFASSLIWGVFIVSNPEAVFLLLNVLAMLFVVYSFVWQSLHRKWCTLCLTIDIVLIVDFLNEIFLRGEEINRLWGIEFYIGLINYTVVFILCLLIIKKMIEIVGQNRMIPLWRFKHECLVSSPGIFWELLALQDKEPIDIGTVPVISNYAETEHSITIIINPACSLCVKVYDIVISLEGYRVNLVFVVNSGDQRSYQAALKMISSGIKDKWEETNRLISDWFEKKTLPENMEIDVRAPQILKMQMDYCKKIQITGTPTIIIDNRRIQGMYDAEDLNIVL